MNLAKFTRTPFLHYISWRLLLKGFMWTPLTVFLFIDFVNEIQFMKYLYHLIHIKGKRLIVCRNINPFKGYMKLVNNLSGGNQIYTRMKWYENKVNLNSSIIGISHQRCYVSVSDKSAGLQACWPTQVFSVNFVEFVRNLMYRTFPGSWICIP